MIDQKKLDNLASTQEVWKDIPGYEGFYQASNIGNIKSLERTVITKWGYKTNKERILKPSILPNGYFAVVLCIYGKRKQFYVHQLVAMAFLGHSPCLFKLVVDHIDNNKLNNKSNNLRLITNRENSNQKHLNCSSKYVGVRKSGKKWRADIRINKIKVALGTFIDEYDAHLAYQNKLNEILDD